MSRLLSLLLLLTCLSTESMAHVLRVAQLNIEQLDSARYSLHYQIPDGEQAIYPSPQLPSRCQWQQQPTRDIGLQSYVFDCAGQPLVADDELLLDWQRSGALVSMLWRNGLSQRQFFPVSEQGIVVSLEDLQAGSGSLLKTAQRYTELGVYHILIGIDHLFFVLAMLLLVSSRYKLIAAITAFTLAHSVTLALSVFELLSLNMAVVESLIALSIVVMAKEIVLAERGRLGIAWHYPALVALIFGLIHGLGFADALKALGIANESIPATLLFFNLGVELGQVLFIAVIWLLVYMAKLLGAKWSKQRQIASAYILGATAMVWFLLRITGAFGL